MDKEFAMYYRLGHGHDRFLEVVMAENGEMALAEMKKQ